MFYSVKLSYRNIYEILFLFSYHKSFIENINSSKVSRCVEMILLIPEKKIYSGKASLLAGVELKRHAPEE